jgi:CheY-like chemotaxis protein
MPKMDGFEVLNWIRSQPQFAKLPVVILTSSNMSDDIQRARQFGASAFLTKPPTFEQLIEMVKQINKKWLVTV